MAKIIPIIKFLKKSRPLSGLMVETLRKACRKQSHNVSFGQTELDGSFMALLQRKFIDANIIINSKGVEEAEWSVTNAGKNALKKLGFNDPC